MQGIPIQPEQASTIAQSVDHLYFFITAVTLFFSVLIFSTIFYFMIKYRRRSPDERPKAIEGSLPLEILWTAVPTLIVALFFVWGRCCISKFRSAAGGHGNICHRQAMDVESRASGRAAGN